MDRNYGSVGKLSNETDCDSGRILYWYSDVSDDDSDSVNLQEDMCSVLSVSYSTAHSLTDYHTFRKYVTSL